MHSICPILDLSLSEQVDQGSCIIRASANGFIDQQAPSTE